MKIKIERSGGFAGIPSSFELDSDDLPPTLQNVARGYLYEKNAPMMSSSSLPKGAADHLNYKITIKDGSKEIVIDCNQYGKDDNLKSLIACIERNSKKRN